MERGLGRALGPMGSGPMGQGPGPGWLGWLAVVWFGLGPKGPVPMGQGPGPGTWAQWARGPGRVLGPMGPWPDGPGTMGPCWLI